ncbi:MAG: hypothetical protein ACK559_18780, partial [bacterium]
MEHESLDPVASVADRLDRRLVVHAVPMGGHPRIDAQAGDRAAGRAGADGDLQREQPPDRDRGR